MRLTAEERKIAPWIYHSLKKFSKVDPGQTVQQIKSLFLSEISSYPEIRPDYFEIADEITLQPIKSWSETENPRAFVAIFLGKVRLIDNIKIIL
jgi:pantoate--beta-alanine ligase